MSKLSWLSKLEIGIPIAIGGNCYLRQMNSLPPWATYIIVFMGLTVIIFGAIEAYVMIDRYFEKRSEKEDE